MPNVRRSPWPRKRYEIVAMVKGAPGPFDRVEGWIDYRVANSDCVRLTPIVGTTLVPEQRVAIILRATGDQTYRGEIAVDLLMDEDYHGIGVCRWTVVAASINLTVKGVVFSAPLFHDDLQHGRPITRYYSHRSYAMTNLDRIDLGEINRAQYGNEADATFSITVRAEAAAP